MLEKRTSLKIDEISTSLVSIAMCTYNGEKYLIQQLDSLINQTYSNLEIIIVDDGSKDSTLDILYAYQQRDSRLKIFQNDTNLGFVQNFSKAISLCSGDYIALADQDDIWKLNKIEIFVNEIGDNLLIYSDAMLIDQYGKSTDKTLIKSFANLVSGKCNKAFLFSNCVSGNTIMFKQELLKYILPIPHISFHDIRIAFVASTIGTITYTEEDLIYYRRHTEQVTRGKNKSNRKKSLLNRLTIKRDEKLVVAQKIIRDLEAYKRVTSYANDFETEYIINLLLEHYYRYEQIFINFKLRRVLLNSLDELFVILLDAKRRNAAKKVSLGLKYHQWTMFS